MKLVRSISYLGLVVRDRGDLEAAEKILTDGFSRAQNDIMPASFMLSYLATVSLRGGKYTQAVTQANGALAMRRELGLHLRTTADLTTLAAAYRSLGDLAQALDYAQQA